MKSRLLYIPIFLFSTLAVYFSAISTDYGFRDDYSITREAHEEPGKVLVFTASHARPLYGVFLELSYRYLRSIDDLKWLRLLSAIFISGFGLAVFRQLRENGWSRFDAIAVALLIIYLPASQVTVSWAVGWPWGISLIFTVIGFRLTEEAWLARGLQRAGLLFAAVLFYVFATAIYQSNTMFAVPLLASLLLVPDRSMETAAVIKRSLFHLLILFVALLSSYILLKILFAADIFPASNRLMFETDIASKINWFLSNCIPNAVAFLTLRDDFNTGAILFWSHFIFVIALIGFVLYQKIRNKTALAWILCLFVFPWIAHAISLVAAERALGYRTSYALSGLVIILLIAAIREVFPLRWRYSIVSLLVVIAALQAYRQSYHLIAIPQAREWAMMKEGVSKLRPHMKTSIYLIEPKPADRSTTRVYRDEFGSFTSNSSWAPEEMFKLALHQRFPEGIPKHWRYTFYHGGEPPPSTAHYNYVIDLRKLSLWRP